MRSKLFATALALALSSPALAEPIIGQASVIDGDTLDIQGSAFACPVSTRSSPTSFTAVIMGQSS
jgi:hypothetical protein